MQWFRMYAEFATDPVVQCLSFDDQRHFVMVLCLKASGLLDKKFGDPQLRTAVMKRAIGLDAKAFEEARNRLYSAGLIDGDWQPLNWNKRQYISDQDPTAAERKRKQRDRERHASVTRDSHSGVTPPVTHGSHPSETDSESDTEQKQRERGSRKALPTPLRGSRLPADFELTSERRQIAEAEAIDPVRTFASFCDYWRSAAGARARKCDWDATWRNWCRSEKGKPGRAGPADSGDHWRPSE